MSTNRLDDRTPTPSVPEERGGWGSQGYVAGQGVPEAEPPDWGPDGYVGTARGRQAAAPEPPDGDLPSDSVTAQEEDLDPGDERPGTHPASVIAGR